MAESVLERTTALVIAQLATYPLSPERVAQLVARTHARLMQGQRHAVTGQSGPVPAQGAVLPADWRQSITRQAVVCLECGATFPRLSVRHLRAHGLNAHAYRTKYGIPRTQPLSAHAIKARRKQ